MLSIAPFAPGMGIPYCRSRRLPEGNSTTTSPAERVPVSMTFFNPSPVCSASLKSRSDMDSSRLF